MKIYILFILIFALLSPVHAQSNCAILLQDLKASKKVSLTKFWDGLKQAIQKKNKKSMSRFFNFPFYGAPLNSEDTSFIVVTKKIFLSRYYKVLLAVPFVKGLNPGKVDEALSSSMNDKNECAINISFPLVSPSKKWEGLQVFMTIEEINSEFKVVSIWTTP